MRRAPRPLLAVFWASVLLSIGMAAAWVARVDQIVAPGEGLHGLDAAVVGRRTLWSRVDVPARPSAETSSARGAELYRQWCAACHGEKGLGDGPIAAAFDPPPRNFSFGRFRLRSTPEGSLPSDADLFRTVSAGILPSRMPAFDALPAADRWALVDEVKRLTTYFDEDEEADVNLFELRPAEPELAIAELAHASDEAALARGEELYRAKGECGRCHGERGLGDGPSAATLVVEEGSSIRPANLARGPALFKGVADARDVLRVLTTGLSGTPMPSYSSSLTEAELVDLAHYTASLWRRERRSPVEAPVLGSIARTAAQDRVRLGERTFLAHCAGCHGKSGRGDGPAMPWLSIRPSSLDLGLFKRKRTEDGSFATADDLKATLREGIPGTSMPPWNLHSEAEIEALVEYLRDLGAARALPPAPLPPLPLLEPGWNAPEAVERGRAVFAARCAPCHGDGGRGDGALAPVLEDFRGERLRPRNLVEEPFKAGEVPDRVLWTITHGFEGTPMPGFARALDAEEIRDVTAFVLSLRAPARSGVK